MGNLKLLLMLVLILALFSCNKRSPNRKHFDIPEKISIDDKVKKLEEFNITKSFDEGIRLSQNENKPLLLMFTGYGATNSRIMEEHLFLSEDDIFSTMKNGFVHVWLYTDDRKKLPVSISNVKTYGEKWFELEKKMFDKNTLPLFAILDGKEEILAGPLGFTLDKEEFMEFLKKGMQAKENKN